MIDGRKLRAFREESGVTQEQVGDRLGTTKQTVSQTERTPNVGIRQAERYLNAVHQAAADTDESFYEISIVVKFRGELSPLEIVS